MGPEGPTMQELTEAIREEAERLLEGGEVDLVIGFVQGTLPLHAAPFFARTVADAERLMWSSFCENNLARYLRGVRDDNVAIIAKGCDTRAIVALINEHQLQRDKVRVIGVTKSGGQEVFVMEYIQARDPNLVRRPFFAKFDPEATWFDQLEPATQQDREFFPPPDAPDWRTSPVPHPLFELLKNEAIGHPGALGRVAPL